MFNDPRKFKQALFFLLFLHFSVLMVISLAGCGGSENISSASSLHSSEVTLRWEDVPGTAAYNLYLSRSPGVTVHNSSIISNIANPITFTDLEPGATYYFFVTVENDSGQIRKSKEMSYTVVNTKETIQLGDILSHSKPDTTVSESKSVPKASLSDSKPTVKASTPETRDVVLVWNDVPNATSYNLYWSDRPGITKMNGTKISNVKNPYKIVGLKKGGKYYFVVTAVNASGESEESEEFSFIVGQ